MLLQAEAFRACISQRDLPFDDHIFTAKVSFSRVSPVFLLCGCNKEHWQQHSCKETLLNLSTACNQSTGQGGSTMQQQMSSLITRTRTLEPFNCMQVKA